MKSLEAQRNDPGDAGGGGGRISPASPGSAASGQHDWLQIGSHRASPRSAQAQSLTPKTLKFTFFSTGRFVYFFSIFILALLINLSEAATSGSCCCAEAERADAPISSPKSIRSVCLPGEVDA